jgi:hypothetical protein
VLLQQLLRRVKKRQQQLHMRWCGLRTSLLRSPQLQLLLLLQQQQQQMSLLVLDGARRVLLPPAAHHRLLVLVALCLAAAAVPLLLSLCRQALIGAKSCQVSCVKGK